MIKQTLCVALLPLSMGVSATCTNDPPEIGDVGPASEVVCNELERRFPRAALAVEGRSFLSPTQVTVLTSVDGVPLLMRYELSGGSWGPDDSSFRTSAAQPSRPVFP